MSGSATVKLSSIPSTVSVSETFVFTSVLLFGVPAGTLTVALDSLVISFWVFRRHPHTLRLMFNMAAPALSIWIGATVFFATSGAKPLIQEPSQISELALPLLLFAVVYFLLNSAMTAVAIAFENRVNPVALWREHYVWVSLNYFGGASLAALLVVYTREIDFTYLAIIVPLLLILYLTFKTSMARVEDANLHLAQMNTLYLSTIETLAMAVDAKDQITHGHIRRVQSYAAGLARALGLRTENDLRAVEAAALLHDMGKLAIPEYILNKPGKLTPAEFEKMKQHARIGADILSEIDFPYPVVPIVRHHHENWDGSGYPDGLAGNEIPVGARVLSVVDCFDALTSDRPYRPRLPDDEALAILKDRSGVMYDPRIVDTFSRIYRTIAPSQREFQSKHGLGRLLRQSPSGAPTSTQRTTFDDIASSSGEMLTFYDLAHSLTAKVTLSDAGDIIAKHLRRLLPASTCVYFMYESETDDLVAKHASGDYAEQVSGLRIAMGERLSGWVAANRQTILNSDPLLDLGDIARSLNPRPRSALCTPLLVEGKLIGVLSLAARGESLELDRSPESISVPILGVWRWVRNGSATVNGPCGSRRRISRRAPGTPSMRG